MRFQLSLALACIIFLQQGDFYHAFLTNVPSVVTTPTTTNNPISLLHLSSPMATPAPDDEAVRQAYGQWRQKYNKGEFDSVRYQNFKSNFLAVTAKNNMDMNQARQMGTPPPTPIQLNEYGDCSAEEYRAIMQRSGGLRDPNTRLAPSNSLQPTNDFNNPRRQQQSSSVSTRQQQMSLASSNLRAAMDQRAKFESELMQLKQRLEEKQKLLQAATVEEQYCKNRIALREEQKRLLNERLRNGWDDERGLM
ncbi:hypothetical protein IV203_003054 [Nitzschia inconspicua]|uniref:Cathepsin propeptide inhibitor domain-containing protein n=1 Tax=Nitzschia inconspicua TaxID=303405 RepID=A0A9K3PQN9_9STRA|nr:hypothetical protein IV203_003054 [Nitzschia inconspicua]